MVLTAIFCDVFWALANVVANTPLRLSPDAFGPSSAA